MPRLRSLAAALFCLICIGGVVRLGMWWVVHSVAANQPVTVAGPHLQLVTDDYDLGRVLAGEPLAARFVIANTGDRQLAFLSAPRRCCSGESPPVTTVPPGRTGEIVVEVAWRELAAHDRQEFLFLTNDLARPEFTLTVRGTVEQPRPAEHSVLVKKTQESLDSLNP